MQVDIWSDVVCPFCYIGKRKFENALESFPWRKDVNIVWHSFQLDPSLEPVQGQQLYQHLAERKGISLTQAKQLEEHVTEAASEVGLNFKFDSAIMANSMDAHRLLHLASEYGVQNQVKELLLASYFTKGQDIRDLNTLVSIGEHSGIPGEKVTTMLSGEMFKAEVSADQDLAAQLGVQGVPFFVFNQKYAVSSAQPSSIFQQVLEKVAAEEENEGKLAEEESQTTEAKFCGPEGC